MKKIYLKVLACMALMPTVVMAQNTDSSVKPFTPASSFRTWSVGVHGGLLTPSVFFGKNDYSQWKSDVGYGIFVKKQILPVFGIKADFLRGGLKGDNSKELGSGAPINNPFSSFKTDLVWSGSLAGELTIANINWLNRKSVVQPYISAGAGLMAYNTTVIENGNEAEFSPGRDIQELFFPVGAGLKFNISPSMSLNLGYTANFVDADNIDGFNQGPQADKFSYAHAALEFSLGGRSKPQLSTYNPVSAMQYDYMAANQSLSDKVDAATAKNAEQLSQIAQYKDQLAKLLADEDKDGVSDYFDKCLGTPVDTKIDGSGCPLPMAKNVTTIITEEDKRIVKEAIRNLEFDFGKTTIREKSFPSLDRVADLLVQKNFSLKLAGHTDNVGSDQANLKLSKDRAESVKQYLVGKGANPSRVEATGYGESQPISSNKTEKGRQMNRRVEFTLF